MVVRDLWVDRQDTHTKRWGRGLRWRVTVPGWPTSSHRTRAEADTVNTQRLLSGPPADAIQSTIGELLDQWLASKQGLSKGGYGSVTAGAASARARWGDTQASMVASRMEGLIS